MMKCLVWSVVLYAAETVDSGPPFPGSAIPTVRLTLTITNPNPNPNT